MAAGKEESPFLIPRGEARAFTVDQGQRVRLVQPAPGGQVGDLLVYNRKRPREGLWGAHTAWRFGVHLTTGAQLISTGPGEPSLATVTGDSLTREPTPGGARFNDVLMSCCSTQLLKQLWGPAYDRPGCYELLSGAIATMGLTPDYITWCWNVFMRTGFRDGMPFLEPTDTVTGDFIELRADQDVIFAISSCHGRSSRPESAGLRVEIQS